MSTLWTPEGEHRIPRENSANNKEPSIEPEQMTESVPNIDDMSEEELEEMVNKVRSEVLSTPAIQIILNHISGLGELAAIHLSVDKPDLNSARLAIDCLEAISTTIKDRVDAQISDAVDTMLNQLRMAWINASS
jgi:hypothetical protein